MVRISIVQNILINSIELSSTFLAGDIVEVKPRSIALAVQREVSSYSADEERFEDHPIFTRIIPQPIVYEKVNMTVQNINPLIKVRNVEVFGISASSLMQVGSNRKIDAEARIKQIRQLLSRSRKTR